MAKILDKTKDKKKKEKPLTDKQTKFCHLYIKYNHNGTRAYMDTFHPKTYNTASVEAHKQLRKPNVDAYVNKLMKECFTKAKITTERILAQLSNRAFQQMDDYIEIDPKTRLFRIRSMEEIAEKGANIKSIKVEQKSVVGEDIGDITATREPIETKIEVKLRGDEKPLELLMKQRGMITDKTEHSFNNEFPLKVEVNLACLKDKDLKEYIRIMRIVEANNPELKEKK